MVLPEKAKKIGRQIYGYERYLIGTTKVECQNYGWVKSKIDHSDSFNNYLIQQHKIGLTNLLYYGDIIAMKHSVENRSPFMDHRLVDYAFEADGYLKVNGSTDKYVLRRGEIYERFRDLLERRKIGFSSQFHQP